MRQPPNKPLQVTFELKHHLIPLSKYDAISVTWLDHGIQVLSYGRLQLTPYKAIKTII